MRRYRPSISVALFVLVALSLPIGLLAFWANQTIYDSQTFSTRAVELLDAPKARTELANRITDQLATAGYRPAVAFRPAFQFAVEVAVDTEAFRSVFRGAVERFHAALLANQGIGDGLDLSDSLSIITSTVQLPSDARSTGGNQSLGHTLESLTQKAADLQIWNWEGVSAAAAFGGLFLALGAAAGGVVVAIDRRKAISRLGLALMCSGVIIVVLRALGLLAARRLVSDRALSDALGDGLSRVTSDLGVIGLWLLGFGAVVTAAVSRQQLSPAAVRRRLAGWVERRRGTQRGWLGIGIGLILAGLVVTTASPSGLLHLAVNVAGLWLVYLGVHELVGHITARQEAEGRVGEVQGERRRLLLAGGAVAAVLVLLTAGFVFATRRAQSRAEAAGERRCNGSAELCSARLDQATFPGTHNSMSAAQYPGWLFGEQIPTIQAQLEGGMRAFLFDTHYGEATNVVVPGTTAPLVVTDRAAELAAPPGSEDDVDPAIEQRAQALRARAPQTSAAQRQIYLCHNYCELGAVRFSTVLGGVKTFLDSHADDVVIFIIQDATTVADTVAAIEQAGLGPRVATLHKGEPLPTLGQLVDSDKRLVVFAEQGGDQAPDWYMKAYDWFQETGFSFDGVDQFNCKTNRGSPSNPLFLLNHWVSHSPPDPNIAGQANSRDVLERRIETCQKERGLLPNIIAVDFGSRGDLLSIARAVDDKLHGRGPQGTTAGAGGAASADASTTTLPSGGTSLPPPGTDLPDVPTQTTIIVLTGGDPAAYCAADPAANEAIDGYVFAALSEDPESAGLADLAFGPVLARSLGPWVAAAPQELAKLEQPLLTRARAATAALGALGVTPDQVDRLADQAAGALADAASDPLTVEQQLVGQLQSAVGDTRLADGARAFYAVQGDVTANLDLGDVSAEVGREAGYDCLATS